MDSPVTTGSCTRCPRCFYQLMAGQPTCSECGFDSGTVALQLAGINDWSTPWSSIEKAASQLWIGGYSAWSVGSGFRTLIFQNYLVMILGGLILITLVSVIARVLLVQQLRSERYFWFLKDGTIFARVFGKSVSWTPDDVKFVKVKNPDFTKRHLLLLARAWKDKKTGERTNDREIIEIIVQRKLFHALLYNNLSITVFMSRSEANSVLEQLKSVSGLRIKSRLQKKWANEREAKVYIRPF